MKPEISQTEQTSKQAEKKSNKHTSAKHRGLQVFNMLTELSPEMARKVSANTIKPTRRY